MNAIEYHLKLRSWQWFGTLTFSDERYGTQRSRESRTDKFLRGWASTEHLSLTAMPCVIRWETGGIGGRSHCHFLLDGFHPRSVTKSNGHRKNAYWFKRNGIARIRPWEASQREQCANYLTAGLERDGGDDWNRTVANEYEIGRFDDSDKLIINEALWKDLQKITGTSFDVALST